MIAVLMVLVGFGCSGGPKRTPLSSDGSDEPQTDTDTDTDSDSDADSDADTDADADADADSDSDSDSDADSDADSDTDTADTAPTGDTSTRVQLTVDDLVAGDLVISEVHVNPEAVADDFGEWVEVYNARASPVDLDGLVMSDDAGESVTVDRSVVVDAGGYVVFARLLKKNGGVPVDWAYLTGFQLGNGGDEIVLSAKAGELDAVRYSVTWPFDTATAMQLSPLSLNASDNDDPAQWCLATTSYGAGDLGTPGGPNDPC